MPRTSSTTRKREPQKAPDEVVKVLRSAYAPCPGFNGPCEGHMQWKPTKGHVPRGFRGGTRSVADIKLVLVCAEPGNPYKREVFKPGKHRPSDFINSVYVASCCHLEEGADLFAQNIRRILEMGWPQLSFEEQMRRTWITESVLCSIHKQIDGRWVAVEGTPVPAKVEVECGQRYLAAQLALFPDARIVALGGKAQRRLARLGVLFEPAWSAAPPGCNRSKAPESWERALAGLKQ